MCLTVMTSPSHGKIGMGWAIASVNASEIDDLQADILRGCRC